MRKQLFVIAIFAVMFLGFSQQGKAAVAITCPNEVRIGIVISCELTGLTVGDNYIVTAVHSGGNQSVVLTAATTTEYARLTMTTADSDGLVPIGVGSATDAGALTGGTTDTALVNLINPSSDIPSAFFQNILASVLIIGIFMLLMSAFFVKRRMKT